MAEVEAKFLLDTPRDADSVLRQLAQFGCRVRPAARVAIADRYLDTPDWGYLRAGWACRRRRQDHDSELALKSLNGGRGPLFRREEVSQSIGDDWRPEKGLPAGPVRDQLGGAFDDRAPAEIFRLKTDRRLYYVSLPDRFRTTVELAIDQTVVRGRRKRDALRFTELELELKEGESESLELLARQLDQRLGLLGARLSKFERGLQAAGIDAPLATAAYAERKLTRDASMLDLAYASLALNLAKLELNEPRAWEGLHPEGVHQMRVATRRLRAALKTFRIVLPNDWRKHMNGELRELARALGGVRDADVYAEHFVSWLTALPKEDRYALNNYRYHLASVSRKARERLHEYLAGERYRTLLRALRAFVAEGPSVGRQRRFGGLTIGYGANALIRGPIDKMLKAGAKIDESSPDEALHALRILGKRARYQTEFFHDFYPKRLNRFLKSCRRLQDVLGEHQDAAVACERLRAYAARVPVSEDMHRELLALGRLIQTQTIHGVEERERFPRFWKRFVKDARRALKK